MRLNLLCLACLLTLLVRAGEQDYLVEFRTEPAETRVYLEVSDSKPGPGEFLGLASEPVRVPRALLRSRGSASFVLEADGYLTTHARLTLGDMESGRYPANGVLVLEPANRSMALVRLLSRGSLWIGAGVLLVVGVAMNLRARAQREQQLRERQVLLERLEARANTGDPYLMMLLGGYRLVSVLGRGASSVVYRALPDDTLDESREVAIKLLMNSADDPDRLARFDRESRVYRQLRHPHIAMLYEVGDQHGLRYLVLQRIRGKTLRELLGQEPVEVLLGWLGQAMAGLHYAHQRGILHRDVKPENIMVELEPAPGPARLMDFGLARLVESRSLTRDGSALGTPAYMAPEVIRGAEVDGRCDQYSCGIVAYEIVAGQRPFGGDEPNTVLYQHLTEDPRDLRELCPDAPPALAAAIMRMIARAPEDRFATIEEARAALTGSPAS